MRDSLPGEGAGLLRPACRPPRGRLRYGLSLARPSPALSSLLLVLILVFPVFAEEQREAMDRDGDGKPEVWLVQEEGRPVRSEVDRNGDGAPDIIRFYREGLPDREQADLNFDGTPDAWSFFKDGFKDLMILDKNRDGRPDAWVYYGEAGLKLIGSRVDEDFDGTPDRSTGAVPKEETRRPW